MKSEWQATGLPLAPKEFFESDVASNPEKVVKMIWVFMQKLVIGKNVVCKLFARFKKNTNKSRNFSHAKSHYSSNAKFLFFVTQ